MVTAWRDEGFVGEFWGSAAAGILFVARDTGRYLLLERSGDVLDPGLWGIPGGAVPVDVRGRRMSLWSAARRETREETGRTVGRGSKRLEQHTWRARGGSFEYTTFVVEMAREFEPRLNWESSSWGWFTAGDVAARDDIHPGVLWVFGQLGGSVSSSMRPHGAGREARLAKLPRFKGRGSRGQPARLGPAGRVGRGRANVEKRLEWVRRTYGEEALAGVQSVLLTLQTLPGGIPGLTFDPMDLSVMGGRTRYDKLIPWLGREVAAIQHFTGGEGPNASNVAKALPSIADWVEGARPRVDLGRFTFKEAKQAQERWHAELARRGGRKLRRQYQGR